MPASGGGVQGVCVVDQEMIVARMKEWSEREEQKTKGQGAP
jgi:hypothetical protein